MVLLRCVAFRAILHRCRGVCVCVCACPRQRVSTLSQVCSLMSKCRSLVRHAPPLLNTCLACTNPKRNCAVVPWGSFPPTLAAPFITNINLLLLISPRPSSPPVFHVEMSTKSLSLLRDTSQRSHASTVSHTPPDPDIPNWYLDRHSILLLIALYTAQGLPMGLAYGSIPFLLKERGSSYADLAQFSLASLPYSVKLLIAPIVDSLYFPRIGRRKSWIVPVQVLIGLTTFLLSSPVDRWVSTGHVAKLMPTFFIIITLVATQDIAVDGWSLTLLQKANVSYASTCQSLGLSIGYFATFTIFLAFSNDQFCNKYIRPLLLFSSSSGAIITLAGVLRLMGVYYLLLTVYIAFVKKERQDDDVKKFDDPLNYEESAIHPSSSLISLKPTASTMIQSVKSTYADLSHIIRLPAVQSLVLATLVAKVGFSAYDNVAPLKLLELGFTKESMASMAVLQAPFTLLGTVLTGRWAAQKSPIFVYLTGYVCRFFLSLTGPPLVYLLSGRGGDVTPVFYILVLVTTILYSIASECLMFVGLGAFFLNVTSSSVHVAGTYLTLLNTSSNMGGTWHKALVLWLVDHVTIRKKCQIPLQSPPGTKCAILFDGYYILSIGLLPVALLVGRHLFKAMPRLRRLPDSAWRASR